MKTLLVLAALGASLSATLAAQLPESTTSGAAPSSPAAVAAGYQPAADRILAEAAARGQTWNLMAELCKAAPHRLAGSPGAERAVAWGKATMEHLGFENVRLEPCMVPVWRRGKTASLVVEAPKELAGQSLRITALGGSVATPEAGLAAEVVEVKSFAALEAPGERARGRIVFFNQPMDPEILDPFAAYGLAVQQRTHGASRAARAGGVAALVRSVTMRVDDSPHTGAMRYDPLVAERVPAAAISTRGAETLSSWLAAGLDLRLRLVLECETLPDAPSFNVVGELVGRELPDEIVVVGGHLDAWDIGQGAHDDGSGTCQSLEVVRLLKALDLRPRRTIRVVLFMNEENGLRGAHAYHEEHAAEMEDHVFALESDRGGFEPRGFTCDAKGTDLETVRAIAALLAGIGADRVVPGGGGADVSPLAQSGVVTAGLLPAAARYFDYHHCELDTPEAVHPRELNLGAGAMAVLCYVVADLPERLAGNGG